MDELCYYIIQRMNNVVGDSWWAPQCAAGPVWVCDLLEGRKVTVPREDLVSYPRRGQQRNSVCIGLYTPRHDDADIVSRTTLLKQGECVGIIKWSALGTIIIITKINTNILYY